MVDFDSDRSTNINEWHEVEQPDVDPDGHPDMYGLGSNLYDAISARPEFESGLARLENFLDQLEMEYIHTIHNLCKKDTRIIPEKDHNLADCFHWLLEDPEWSVVQSDKKGQWLPILVKDYIADMEVHLCRYCNKIPRLHLDRVYKDTMTLIDEIDHLCSDREE